MKFVFALCFASAAIVSASGAGAAELPSRNPSAPPAANAKRCSVDGAPGFIAPGTDICIKISGEVSAQFSAGSIAAQRTYGVR